MRWKLGGTAALAAAVLVALAYACAGRPPAVVAPAPAARPGDVETSLFLIGDAGLPAPGGEPVLMALTQALAAAGGDRVVAFLGDNIYPRGMPDSTAPSRADAERSLRASMEAARAGQARAYFLPGNHDWSKLGPDGWNAVRRQEQFVAAQQMPGVSLVPSGGCPGPVAEPLGQRLLLIALDTQWWLHGGPKPIHPTSSCPADSEQEVADSLRAILAGAGGRVVVVAAHHPIMASGPHGGFFPWTDHIFPLRKIADWMWLPLPVIGSTYPLMRMAGVSPQDLSHPNYKRMRRALEVVMAPTRPLVFTSGHEHALEVMEGKSAQYMLISGGGYYGHTNPVAWNDATLFARQASGFMRLEVLKDGRVRLGVIQVDAEGVGAEVYGRWLRE